MSWEQPTSVCIQAPHCESRIVKTLNKACGSCYRGPRRRLYLQRGQCQHKMADYEKEELTTTITERVTFQLSPLSAAVPLIGASWRSIGQGVLVLTWPYGRGLLPGAQFKGLSNRVWLWSTLRTPCRWYHGVQRWRELEDKAWMSLWLGRLF